MYFWKAELLEQDLIANAVSEQQQMKYFFVFFVVLYILYELFAVIFPYYFEDGITHHSIYDVYTSALGIISEATGFFLCYHTNRGGDNRHFVVRFITLYLPHIVQMLALAIGTGIVLVIATIIADISTEDPRFSMAVFLWIAALTLWFWYRMTRSFRRIAHADSLSV